MTLELSVLAWGCVLGIVHIFVAVRFKTRQYGTKWNVGPRDEEMPPPDPIAGRLARAQANFFETFPLAAAAILIVHVARLEDRWTALGAVAWLGARLDGDANVGGSHQISREDSAVRVLVIPTNEQVVIARGAASLLSAPIRRPGAN